jgi:hypothetical protein
MILRGGISLLLMVSPLVLSIVSYTVSCCCFRIGLRAGLGSNDASFGTGVNAAALRALPSVILISFCLVQSVSAGVFSAWDCAEFVLDSATGETKAFLREDLSVECGTEQHGQIQSVAYIFFAIWPVGQPLLYLLMLLRCRDALITKRSTPLTHATLFLHQEYTSRFFWWEPLFAFQRLMVTGFVMILFQSGFAIRRIIFGISTTLVYLAMLLAFRPYVRFDLNFLAAIGSQFALALSMLVALCMRIFNDITTRYDLGGAQHIMKFDGPSEVSSPNGKSGALACAAMSNLCILQCGVRRLWE